MFFASNLDTTFPYTYMTNHLLMVILISPRYTLIAIFFSFMLSGCRKMTLQKRIYVTKIVQLYMEFSKYRISYRDLHELYNFSVYPSQKKTWKKKLHNCS